MKHYHYEIQGFNNKAPYPEGEPRGMNEELRKREYQMGECTVIQVIALTEKEALKKAEKMVIKNYYRIMKSFECEESQSLIDPQDLALTQLEMQKKILDALKGHHG